MHAHTQSGNSFAGRVRPQCAVRQQRAPHQRNTCARTPRAQDTTTDKTRHTRNTQATNRERACADSNCCKPRTAKRKRARPARELSALLTPQPRAPTRRIRFPTMLRLTPHQRSDCRNSPSLTWQLFPSSPRVTASVHPAVVAHVRNGTEGFPVKRQTLHSAEDDSSTSRSSLSPLRRRPPWAA